MLIRHAIQVRFGQFQSQQVLPFNKLVIFEGWDVQFAGVQNQSLATVSFVEIFKRLRIEERLFSGVHKLALSHCNVRVSISQP